MKIRKNCYRVKSKLNHFCYSPVMKSITTAHPQNWDWLTFFRLEGVQLALVSIFHFFCQPISTSSTRLAEVTSLRISDVHWAVLLCLVSQIGSYFGSVLTTIDINKDSYTDTLLIGAPMYMGTEKEEQGKVYVYTLNQVMVSEFGRNPGKSFPSLQFWIMQF